MKKLVIRICSTFFIPSLIIILAFGAPARKPAAKKKINLALRDKLAAIASSKCLVKANVGIKVVSLDDGEVIFEKNAYEPLIPASNMKVLTSAAAFHYLKPEYTFKTVLYHDGQISGKTLKGNLCVKGYGAPDLVGENVWIMMKEFCESGIRRIEEDIIGDDTYFDSIPKPVSWPDNVDDNPYGAPVSALSCNYSSVRITIKPGQAGGKPIVTLFPFSDFFRIINNAKTNNGNNNLFIRRVFEEGANRILLSGSISYRSGEFSEYRSVDNPTLYTLSCIRETLRELGVEVTGTIKSGPVPSKARQILVFKSKPLAQIVYDMNKNSNNFIAEMLLKTLGAEVIGQPGTTEKGCDVLRMFLRNSGIDTSRIAILDGSGLSRRNLLTADCLTHLLKSMDEKFGEGYEFVSSLPIGGADGTLRRQLYNNGVARRVRGKTGYISGVKSLSGYVENLSGERFAFAFIVNSSKCGPYDVQEQMDKFCEAISSSSSSN
ncbi:MAG: D-alanyl-D-alanine carboxypeptidase/D-alanyl-D-alanine-endopeptidase [Acidobacteriota bacterium]